MLRYDKCVNEKNLTLLLDTTVFNAENKSGKIAAVYARSDKTLKLFRIKSKIYINCTGDSRLAMVASPIL